MSAHRPAELRKRLAQGSLPLAVALMVVVTVSAPTAYYVLRVREARARAGSAAHNLAATVTREATSDPLLWKYNSLKVLRHVREFELQSRVSRVQVADTQGAAIDGRSVRPSGAVVWGRAPVHAADAVVGHVWVAVSIRDSQRSALLLAFGFAWLGLLLGGLLYLLPLRIVTDAERQLRRSARLRELTGRSASLEEAERRAIARDLHDSTGQTLTAIRINLQLLADKTAGTGSSELVSTALGLTDQTLEEIRRAVASLGPAIIDDVGLATAVERMCADAAERSGLRVDCRIELGERALPPAVETASYRIIGEALTNVERHADATEVEVSLLAGVESLAITVRDDGRGFDPTRVRDGGTGLASMRERAELLGGELHLDSQPGEGTRIRVVLPVLRVEGDRVASPGG